MTNLLKFSTSLCEKLFRVADHLENLKGRSEVSVKLSKCASDFNRIVVETLEIVGSHVKFKKKHNSVEARLRKNEDTTGR